MDPSIKNFFVDSFDPDCLMSVKAKLGHQGLLDSLLKTNLDFSIQAMAALPAPRRHNAWLKVDGDKFLLTITTGSPILYYTVYRGPNGPQLHQRVKPESKLSTSSLLESHFAGHRCRDEIESCMTKAKKALSKGEKKTLYLNQLELKIICGELHLTYSTLQPLHSIHIQPRRRVHMGETLSVEKILETKAHMEKSGEMGKSMLACFHSLLVSPESYWGNNSRIILQGDGEMVEFVTDSPNEHKTEHFIYTDAHNNAQIKQTKDIWGLYD